jgi:hypothetical protein
MKSRALRIALLAAAAALPLAGAGCASDEPYAVPQASPQRTMRTPLVAPSGPASPWWWPFGESLWPFGY